MYLIVTGSVNLMSKECHFATLTTNDTIGEEGVVESKGMRREEARGYGGGVVLLEISRNVWSQVTQGIGGFGLV